VPLYGSNVDACHQGCPGKLLGSLWGLCSFWYLVVGVTAPVHAAPAEHQEYDDQEDRTYNVMCLHLFSASTRLEVILDVVERLFPGVHDALDLPWIHAETDGCEYLSVRGMPFRLSVHAYPFANP